MTARVLPTDLHDKIVAAAYRQRGFNEEESAAAARLCRTASWHGVRTHNAIKALHLDDLFGSGNPERPGCVPDATIDKAESRFDAVEAWVAHRKLGQATAYAALERCIELADTHGVGIVTVDEAFHYLWGGGYVMEAANRGYIAYTHCTAALAEVVPFGGRYPTLGTNPHSWGLPTTDAVGFPIVIDWATSTVAMGRVQQFAREGEQLPENAAVDAEGRPTTDPEKVAALLPFGRHKGYGLSLLNELSAALIGGSLPTIRCRPTEAGDDEKITPNFYFQVIHPEAVTAGAFAAGRDQTANVKAVIEDVLGHGNENCLLPGQIEHQGAQRSEAAGGLIFSDAEIAELTQIAEGAGETLDATALEPAPDS
ncbi:MAG: Ldh family oxidoreductase [Phycisphaeraceae bacterium]|nr:Ldh family oxidoreductase [Phycisphaeraceae bacterium]